ncbi:hypothetical protein GGR52DRAFT_428700 [Hypoxylon sp. FL1284]|nr:hypothetical protein GGR52DRAFT_428700 [Hypoxylon sp. FL1284]
MSCAKVVLLASVPRTPPRPLLAGTGCRPDKYLHRSGRPVQPNNELCAAWWCAYAVGRGYKGKVNSNNKTKLDKEQSKQDEIGDESYPGTGPSVVMMGFKPSFFLFLFRSVEFVVFPVEFEPLPLAPAIIGIVVEGDIGPTAPRAADGSESFALFIVSSASGNYVEPDAVADSGNGRRLGVTKNDRSRNSIGSRARSEKE